MKANVHINRKSKDSEVSIHEVTERVAGGQQGVYRRPNIQVDSPLWYYMPPAPENLVRVSSSAGSVELGWDDVTEDFDTYTVYVQNNNTGELEQVVEGVLISEHEVTGLSEAEYEFWVTAIEGNIESAESNHVQILLEPPDAPENFVMELVVDSGGNNDIDCTWDAVSGVSGYNVYLSDDGGSTFTKQNGSLIATTEFTIQDVSDGEYQAYVTAFANQVESGPSNKESLIVGSDYKFYRVVVITSTNTDYANTREFLLMDTVGGSSLPPDGNGTPSASDSDPGTPAEDAFNGITTSEEGWRGFYDDAAPDDLWLQWEFNNRTEVVEYGIGSYISEFTGAGAFDSWRLEGSFDGESWDTLDEQSGHGGTWSDNTVKRFEI